MTASASPAPAIGGAVVGVSGTPVERDRAFYQAARERDGWKFLHVPGGHVQWRAVGVTVELAASTELDGDGPVVRMSADAGARLIDELRDAVAQASGQ
jgi:hypothetical protein